MRKSNNLRSQPKFLIYFYMLPKTSAYGAHVFPFAYSYILLYYLNNLIEKIVMQAYKEGSWPVMQATNADKQIAKQNAPQNLIQA